LPTIRRRPDTRHGGFHVFGGNLALGRFPAQVDANFGNSFIEENLLQIAEQHIETRLREDMSNPAAHSPCTNNGNGLN
jgi:hypothetical protein